MWHNFLIVKQLWNYLISQPSVIKVISKKQLFFKVELGLKHDNDLFKNCKKNFTQPASRNYFCHLITWKQTYFFSWSDISFSWATSKICEKSFLRMKTFCGLPVVTFFVTSFHGSRHIFFLAQHIFFMGSLQKLLKRPLALENILRPASRIFLSPHSTEKNIFFLI